MRRGLRFGLGVVLSLCVEPALAQNPNYVDTTVQYPTGFVGTDTLNKLMDDLITALAPELQGGITTYLGLGSSCGERMQAGSPLTTEPWCRPTDNNGSPETNPGCQEIAPMTRELQSGICDDDGDVPGAINSRAEAFAFCADALAIVAHNDSLGAFGDSAESCQAYFASTETPNDGDTFPDRGVGRLRRSGKIAGYTIQGWKDVLRLLYTGCKNTQGLCADTVDRISRCSDPVRQALVNNWGALFEGVACPQSGGCPTGLRHAYRREDASGTTGAFLSLLGVAGGSVNLASRTSLFTTIPAAITPVPSRLAFCDGGDIEGLLPTHLGPATLQFPAGEPRYDGGDPLRTNCAPEDDLCAPDQKLGVVRAIHSTHGLPHAFATHQCLRKFEYVQYMNTALPVCPDRTRPSAGRCKFPFFESGGFRTFNCLTSIRQASPNAAAGTDGRAYNFVVHEPNGAVVFRSGSNNRMPVVATWRQNMAHLRLSSTGSQGPLPFETVCTEHDAGLQIGCLTASSKCTVGVAARAAAFSSDRPAMHRANEPTLVDGHTPSSTNIATGAYPLARPMWLTSSRGFENVMEDCKDRGGSKAYCEAQHRIASELYNVGQPGNLTAGLCRASGFVALDGPVCRGAMASAGCGAPTEQSAADCAPDPRIWDELVNHDN